MMYGIFWSTVDLDQTTIRTYVLVAFPAFRATSFQFPINAVKSRDSLRIPAGPKFESFSPGLGCRVADRVHAQ